MKVCLLAPVPPFRGGIAKYCHSLALELEKRHELQLLSYSRQYPRLLFGDKSQTDPEVDRGDILAQFRRLSFSVDSASPKSWLRARREIIAFKPDLVILPWWVAYWAPLYLYLLHGFKKRGIRTVFLCINVFEHEGSSFKNFLTRLTLKRVAALIVHSEPERQAVLHFHPKAGVTKHLLPLFEYAAPTAAVPGERLNLLFFGFVRAYKGLDTLLKAIAILRDRNIALTIAGEFWSDKEDYLVLIRDLHLEDKVEILDRYLSDQEMSLCFSRADLVVLPYKRSLTSGVIATAYGFRKPVLATDVGGFGEIVQDGYTGKLVPPDNPPALAEAILWFSAHREIDFGANIAQFTGKKMSWSSLVDAIERCDGGKS